MWPGRTAQRDQPLDDLLRDPADDAVAPRVERHPRPDHRRRRGAAEKTVALDEQRARAGARRRQRRGAARISTTDHQDIVIHKGHIRCDTRGYRQKGPVWTAA